ncbi:MAG TPA: ABC transporter ATP-binding protein [Lacipirellulaceae bacterium]|nr:ABC transporter ATP-binding protein [Lacipirellulaceae bacterium]
MTLVIELKNVTKRYRSQKALDDVSFEVPRGVVFALLGENGAGKTTAIRLMLGLAEATAGEVRVVGMDARRDGFKIRRRVGYLSERPVFYEWMTAAEIGWFTAGFYPDGFEPRYRALVDDFHVPLDRRLSQMSKGMRAKVGLSLAMAHSPELLILDEPTSGLDTMVRREFLESMVDIAAEGRTVLLSSHQIGEVERVADIVAIMHAGRLLVNEPLEDLKRSARQLMITVAESSTPRPAVDGVVIYERRRGRQWDVLVRGLEEVKLEQLRFADGVVAVESRTPSLEEIFVAYVGTDGNSALMVEALPISS